MSCFALKMCSFSSHALKTVVCKGTSTASCHKKKKPKFNNLLQGLMYLLLVVVERMPGFL